MIVDFSSQQTKFVLEGLITQTVLPFSDFTKDIKEGDRFPVSFDGMILSDYFVLVTGVSIAKLKNTSNDDVFKNGFIYKPAFFKYVQSKGIVLEDTVVKIDFTLEKGEPKG